MLHIIKTKFKDFFSYTACKLRNKSVYLTKESRNGKAVLGKLSLRYEFRLSQEQNT